MNEINDLNPNRDSSGEDAFERHFNAWKASVSTIRNSENIRSPRHGLLMVALGELKWALHAVHLVLAFLSLVDNDIDTLHADHAGALIAFLRRIGNFFMNDDGDIELDWFLTLGFNAINF